MPSTTAAPAARAVRGGGLKLKGGIVIRAARPQSTTATDSASTTAAKRKQPSDSETATTHTSVDPSIKSELPSPPPPHSPTADSALPSEAPQYVKRTRRADEVEEVNARLQQLNKANELVDRRQLIEQDRQRAAVQLAAAGTEGRDVDGLRLVELSRGYVKSGFGDESKLNATRKLNEREKKKSDRYCK